MSTSESSSESPSGMGLPPEPSGMPSGPSSTSPKKATSKPKRFLRLSADGKRLSIIRGKRVDSYVVERLDPHPMCGRLAWRLTKMVDGRSSNVYDVILTQWGVQCDCRGFLRWGKCKHVDSLFAAGKFSLLTIR